MELDGDKAAALLFESGFLIDAVKLLLRRTISELKYSTVQTVFDKVQYNYPFSPWQVCIGHGNTCSD